MTTVDPGLRGQVRRGLAWSAVSTVIMRFGTFALGIVLARILTPREFGTYAVALTVQVILVSVADFGLSANLIRSRDPAREAPTVAALGLIAGGLSTAVAVLTAPFVANALDSPDSAPVIAVLAWTLLLGGAGVVPLAMLQRGFEQKKLFAISVVDFVVSTAVTLGFLMTGWGVMSLAIGRVTAQSVTLVLQFALAGLRPRVHIDRALVRPVFAFGVPVAAANLLSWGLLSIDNVVIARLLGPVALGFYVLAFNISNWPMSAIGQVVRSVALPAFAQTATGVRDRSLARAVALAWAVALPAGALLAVLSAPLIAFVYGTGWLNAAPVLAALGVFGAFRVVFDLFAAYLLARGAAAPVLRVQILWFVVLVPATIVGARWLGVAGAGWAHVVVAVLVVLPAYLWALRRAGADLRAVAAAVWPSTLAAVPAATAAYLVAQSIDSAVVGLVAGGAAAGVLYVGLLGRWLRTQLKAATGGPPEPVIDPPDGALRAVVDRTVEEHT